METRRTPPYANVRPLSRPVSASVRHRSGGTRPDVSAPPLDLSGLGRSSTRAVRYMEGLTVPKGKGARSRLRLRRWQKKIA
jgi:hypothetical protein